MEFSGTILRERGGRMGQGREEDEDKEKEGQGGQWFRGQQW